MTCAMIYDSDNEWGMRLGAKNQNDADICALAEILKEDDNGDEESEEEEKEKEEEKKRKKE